MIAAVHNNVEEGKHDNNPEATLSTFGLPSVFDLYYEPVPLLFVCLHAVFNELLSAFVDEMRNEEIEKEFE